ncbi:MAG TPA: alpha/beta hydrolase [Trebonia sp.]|jgi:pimeloyl-ACP methyl ester carboxylesterase|nr:alpha/beta hydrolase [Trebonia sp.]
MDDHSVLLVHGLASSFEHNWRAAGWVDILADEGRPVIGMDLPGHGANAAQDPAEISPAAAVLAATGDRAQVDAVGFSAGGHALLAAAASAPGRFRKIALLGVGDPSTPADGLGARIEAGLESDAEPDDQVARLIWRLAATAGNDRRAVARYLRAPHPGVVPAELALIDVPVLVVLGDRDFAGPADRLLAALPDARLVTLRGVDHFSTPSDYGCIEAVTSFLAS